METKVLQSQKNCDTLKADMPSSPLQPPLSPFLKVYFQERRRALLTELKAIDAYLQELKAQSQ